MRQPVLLAVDADQDCAAALPAAGYVADLGSGAAYDLGEPTCDQAALQGIPPRGEHIRVDE